jgi:hypothetical protein
VFRLPLRQAEDFLRSLFDVMDLSLETSDHTTISRRSKDLKVKLEPVNSKRSVHLIVDSTGLSMMGEGEWAAAKHGKRGWRKLHICVGRGGQIHAQVLTDSSADDASTGLKIIKKTRGKLSSVTGDAAYDTVAIYMKSESRGARFVIPPSRSASISRRKLRSTERDKTIRRVNKVGRRWWKKGAGYHWQGTVENAFFRHKSILGDRLYARGLAAQKAEVVIGCKVLSRLLDLGRPKSVAIVR